MANSPTLAQQDWWQDYGQKIYLLLLHANFLTTERTKLAAFRKDLLEAATLIPSKELTCWLQGGSWRETLTAAWLIGLRQDLTMRGLIESRFLDSVICFAGQGYCFALARYGDDRAISLLIKYLEDWLPAGERQYDQGWAIGALAWLDSQKNTKHSQRFLVDAHLWELTRRNQVIGKLDPQREIAHFFQAMLFVSSLC